MECELKMSESLEIILDSALESYCLCVVWISIIDF